MRFVIPDLADPNAHPKAVRRAVGHRAAAVRRAFRDHNERIRPLLPPPLQRLQEMSLHDGLIQSLRIDPGQGTLRLCLLCDDSEGYFDLILDYKDIHLNPQETSLFCLIAHAGAEVDRDELDLAPHHPDEKHATGSADSWIFIHRISWHTGIQTGREDTGPNALGEATHRVYTLHPEIELRFADLEMEITRRPDRQLSRPQDYITVVRDLNEIRGMDRSESWTSDLKPT